MMQNNSENVNGCAICHIAAKQSCSACKSVKYCGAEHQRQHWKEHKKNCRPVSIAKDEILGRHLIASRDISQGNTIFVEAPLVVGPKWYFSERDGEVPVMPCVGCFTPCRMGVHSCSRCHWPACSADCAGLMNPQLHALECTILMLGPGPIQSNNVRGLVDYYRTDALMVLKCLMLQRLNPKKWLELMDMQSHEDERLGSDLYKEAEQRIVTYLQHNFLQRLKSVEQQSKEQYLQQYDVKVLHRICGIIETNYMCINMSSGLELSGLFYTACMIEHSCQPNCYFQFDERNGLRISVIAGRDIKQGEHLQIMYSNMLWGTQMRQEHLSLTKHFKCACARCKDPTELGTYFSALLCMGDVGTECGGIQLSKNPLDEKGDWTCNTCPMILSNKEMKFLLTQIGNEVDALSAKKPTIKQLEMLIEKLSKFLHPNHYHLFGLKHSLIQLYGVESGYQLAKLSPELLEKKQRLCEELYAVCQGLDPYTIRLSIYVGIILYEWHTVQVEKANRLLAKMDKTATEVQLAKEMYELAKGNLENAKKVLKKELDNVAGSKLYEAVENALYKVVNLINQQATP